MTDLTAVSLFAGIGGFDLALTRAGVRVVAAVEIDPACRGVLARHFPGTTLFPDVREVSGDQLRAAGFDPRHGIITAGWPCQDLSMAGRRAGLGGARSGLFWHVVRLARELSPQWLVLENVPGLLSAVCSCPGDGACVAAGRAVRCGTHDTHNGRRTWRPGVPHTVPGGACPGGCMAAHGGAMGTVVGALAGLGYGLCWRVLDAQHFGVPQRRERLFFAGCLGDGAAPVQVLLEPESSTGHPAPGRPTQAQVAGTLASRARGGRTTDLDGHGAYLAGTLGGGSGQRGWCDDYERMTFLPVTHPHASNDEWDLSQPAWVTHPLTAEGADASEDGRGRGTPLIPVASPLTSGGAASHRRSAGRRREDDTNLVALPLQDGRTIAKAQHGGGIGGPGEPSYTLDATGAQSVATPRAVRRLTPRECERLQGFPDDWTRQVASGTVQSDSARYRELGNAVPVPVVEWIARRLVTTAGREASAPAHDMSCPAAGDASRPAEGDASPERVAARRTGEGFAA